MVHDLLFHSLVLFGFLELSMSLVWAWRRRHASYEVFTREPAISRSHLEATLRHL
jgi:hypothetical protein